MAIAALIVSIVVTLAAVGSVWYARNADRSAARTAALDLQRRHAEIRPRFRVTCAAANPGSETVVLTVALIGPPELERLDGLTVVIRDDNPWRAEAAGRTAVGPTAEQIAAQIWGPRRFIPGTGPLADPVRGVPGADRTGRTTPTTGMPVGEELRFFLEPTRPPQRSSQSQPDWQRERGTALRLRLHCQRDGWEPWTLACEIDTAGTTSVDIP